MKNNWLILAGVAGLIAFSTSSANALVINFAYTWQGTAIGTGYANYNPLSPADAVGQLVVVGNTAVGGVLIVSDGVDAGTYQLVTAPPTGDDGQFVYDNVVYPGLVNGGLLDGSAGLLWSVSGVAGNSPEMNMWYNSTPAYGSPGPSYSLWGAPPTYNVQSYGSLTYSLVPDGGMTVSMLGLAVGACGLFARRMKKLA